MEYENIWRGPVCFPAASLYLAAARTLLPLNCAPPGWVPRRFSRRSSSSFVTETTFPLQLSSIPFATSFFHKLEQPINASTVSINSLNGCTMEQPQRCATLETLNHRQRNERPRPRDNSNQYRFDVAKKEKRERTGREPCNYKPFANVTCHRQSNVSLERLVVTGRVTKGRGWFYRFGAWGTEFSVRRHLVARNGIGSGSELA